MTRMGAENLLAAGAVWASIMLPSAAFGGDPTVAKDGYHAAEIASVCTVSQVAAGRDRLDIKVRA